LQNSISKLATFIDTDGKNSKETLNKTLKWLILGKYSWRRWYQRIHLFLLDFV
jgi:hypothetical protein